MDLASFAVSGVRSTWDRYVALRNTAEENEELRRELERTRTVLYRFKTEAEASGRLKTLLALRERLPEESIPAEVMKLALDEFEKMIIINRGREEGVVPDLAVVSSGGVVGRVVSVYPHRAKVQLIIDPSAGVAVQVERTRTQTNGIAVGGRGLLCRVKFVSKMEDVRLGDRLLTSGLGGIYPKGLVVGQVASLRGGADMNMMIDLRPSIDFRQLEEVLVLTGRTREISSGERISP